MIRRFCQECGAAAEVAAPFCSTCGARLAAPPGDAGVNPRVDAPAPAPAPAGVPAPAVALAPANRVRLLALATVGAIAILVGGAVVVDRFRAPGGPTSSPPSMPGVTPTQAAAATTTPAPTPGPSTGPASPTTAPIATPGPGASPALVAAETPLGAVAAFLEARGIRFAGTCDATDPVADTGSYCTELVEDREALQVHWIGPVGSEPDTWLLVAAGQSGWAVIEWAPVEGRGASPPF